MSETKLDNVVDIKDPMVRLTDLLNQTLGENYVLGESVFTTTALGKLLVE